MPPAPPSCLRSQATVLFLAIVSATLLNGCGGTQRPALDPAALAGNWQIAENPAVNLYPASSTAIFVTGNRVTAEGIVEIKCPKPGFLLAERVGFSLAGQVAPDGTFQLAAAFPNVFRVPTLQIALSGTIPTSPMAPWTGSYTLTSPPGSGSCLADQTAPFTATAIPPFNGTLVGTLSGGVGSTYGDVTFGTTLVQGAPVSSQHESDVYSYLPLSGTVALSGASCFTHGAAPATSMSQIRGNSFFLVFLMDDGSKAQLDGDFTDATQRTIQHAVFYITGGKCDGKTFSGTLLRP